MKVAYPLQFGWLPRAVILFLLPLLGHSQSVTDLAANFVSRVDIRSSGSLGDVSYSTAEGDFPTICGSKNEEVKIELTVPPALVGKVITIRSDDGGVIKGGDDAAGTFTVAPKDKEGLLKFTYTLGGVRGRYTLKIKAPGCLQNLEFWVGEPSPVGQAGPARNFPKIPEIPDSPKIP